MLHLGDIRTIDAGTIEPVDVITGGSPCQDLSIAGTMTGLNGDRSGLFREQIRLVKQMRKLTGKPRFMVWENVPGAMISNGGKDFWEVLNECVRVKESNAPAVPMPKNGWPNAGCLFGEMGDWSIAWRIHDAQFWGVPQRRKRIALVCDFGGMSAPEILFERKGVHGNFETGKKTAKLSARNCHGNALFSVYDARGNGDGLTAATITGDHESRVTDYTNLVFSFGVNGDQRKNWPFCNLRKAHTLGTTIREQVFSIANGQRGCSALQELSHTLNCMHDHETIIHRGSVRRLTPLECTRLQGFPDGWVDIGDWVDTKGKTHKECDTPKYKALGNSIALPFWRWLMERIYAEIHKYEQNPTLGSLFDGIGGFPLCFPGETKWASEIDEFCIAVTKKHFGNGEKRQVVSG